MSRVKVYLGIFLLVILTLTVGVSLANWDWLAQREDTVPAGVDGATFTQHPSQALEQGASAQGSEQALGIPASLTPTPATLPQDSESRAILSDTLVLAEADKSPASILPFTYARVVTDHVPVYAHPKAALEGLPPLRYLGEGYQAVSLAQADPIYQDGGDWVDNEGWYLLNEGEYVQTSQLAVYTPSAFQGVEVSTPPAQPFGWVVFDTKVSSAPGIEPAATAPLLKRYTPVTIYEEQQLWEWTWYRIGPDQWLRQNNLALVMPATRPSFFDPDEKWLEVNLYEQTLAAYEGDRMVYATLVSTGRPDEEWATEPGFFRIWAKVKMANMTGAEGTPDKYFLENVPWALHFSTKSAIHAAYWHDRFGLRTSHGCINVAPQDARWLFDWTMPLAEAINWTTATDENPGTWVWVHE